jgi:hypothetical protein
VTSGMRGIQSGVIFTGDEFSHMVDQYFDHIYTKKQETFDEVHFLPRIVVSDGRAFEVRLVEVKNIKRSADLAQKENGPDEESAKY